MPASNASSAGASIRFATISPSCCRRKPPSRRNNLRANSLHVMKSDLAKSIPTLKRLLPNFQKMHMGVLGDLMLDRYLWGDATRLSPEAAVPVVDLISQSQCLGGAGNVAANLAALGAHVELFGVVGGANKSANSSPQKSADDDAGSALRSCLRQAAIGDRGVLADSQRVTTVKPRVIARHQQLVRIDQERRVPLAPQSEEKLDRKSTRLNSSHL